MLLHLRINLGLVSLPIGGEVISRQDLHNPVVVVIECIPTYWWGGNFETCTLCQISSSAVVSLPIGGEVISRRE